MRSITYIGYPVSNHVFVVVDSGKRNLFLLGAGRDHKKPLEKEHGISRAL